jgi:hypothetical protein
MRPSFCFRHSSHVHEHAVQILILVPLLLGAKASAPQDSYEERLRERWDEFMAAHSKPLAFDETLSSPASVAVVAGKDLRLTCGLTRPLTGRQRISFIRQSDTTASALLGPEGLALLLSVGESMNSQDARLEVRRTRDDPRVWTLTARAADSHDAGRYECQLNTLPNATSRFFDVVVVKSNVSILPAEKVLHVNEGSNLRLTCVVSAGPVRPSYVMWYRGDQIVQYDDSVPDGRSELTVTAATRLDSGEYRCDSDVSSAARIAVYVERVASEELQELPVANWALRPRPPWARLLLAVMVVAGSRVRTSKV